MRLGVWIFLALVVRMYSGVASVDAQVTTFTLSTKESIRTYVNTNDGANISTNFSNQGFVKLTTAGAQRICSLAGFSRVVSTSCRQQNDSRCNFTSCGDNFLSYWSGTSWVRAGACGGNWLSQITCDTPIIVAPKQCGDNIDNDNDGLVDFPQDPGCVSTQDNDEFNALSQCSDGIDNDQDGAIDSNGAKIFSSMSVTLRPIQGTLHTIDVTQGQIVRISNITGHFSYWNGSPSNLPCNEVYLNTIPEMQYRAPGIGTFLVTFVNSAGSTISRELMPNLQQEISAPDTSHRMQFSFPDEASEYGDNSGSCSFTVNLSTGNAPADPECRDSADNSEVSLPECSDGIDNDIDGATDFPNDFSCISATDNNETKYEAACQNRLDNDQDGLVDFPQDPGCVSKQDNDESNALPQCSDGLDNDGDGATDFPNDFSCTSATDNDETNQKAACQDGFNNDFDVFVDFPQDTGCVSNQDNDESNAPLPACRDGIDNDGDGRTDAQDPGCSNPDDTNEGDEAACQDLRDNDNDGLIDFPFDPGCTSPTDTDEFNAPQTIDLSIMKTGPTSVTRGQPISYTIQVGNAGQVTATNVVVTDSIPAGLTFNDALSYGPCTATNNVVTCPLGSFGTGFFGTFNIAFDTPTVPNCTTASVINSATISATEQDGNQSNNSSSTQNTPTRIDCPQVPQCQDGIDNDNDGSTDFPNDFSCTSPTDNDETNQKAACQDGLDSDNDELVDFPQDPGCVSTQDTDEYNSPLGPALAPAPAPNCLRLPHHCEDCSTTADSCGPCPDGTVPSPTPFPGCAIDDPPPICPVGCLVDADCGEPDPAKCSMKQLPGGGKTNEPLCWKDKEELCVKRCKIPRCINNTCTEGGAPDGAPGAPYIPCDTNKCPAPRCGDGVVQGTGVEDNENGGVDDGCSADFPTCGDSNFACPNGETRDGGSNTCGDNKRCYRCVSDSGGGAGGCQYGLRCNVRKVGDQCSITQSSCGPGIALEYSGTCTRDGCSGRCFKCNNNQFFATASLLKGSSLLATSIVNNCSTSCLGAFAEANCGPGEACFALMGAHTAQQHCAPADCAGREEDADCGMTDFRSGNQVWEWGICGSGNPPDEPNNPDDPPGEPSPPDGEECDDSNNTSNDGCSATCQKEVCGDGITQVKGADGKPNTADDEECDDGNLEPGDGCDEKCQTTMCGDGVIDHGEECDDGDENSDTEPGACRADCTKPKCDDGVVDNVAPYFEECDCGPDGSDADDTDDPVSPMCETTYDGKPALCTVGSCTLTYCGDGFAFNAGQDREFGTADDEMCDNGPFNSDDPAGSGKCSSNAMCPGAVCVDGECTQVNCVDHDECSGGRCVRGSCKPGGCATDVDCGAAKICNDDNECVVPQTPWANDGLCVDNNDCPSGYCHDNGHCMQEVQGELPDATCRLDCKAVRCGDGIVDEGKGETCDEGEAMMKCNGFPQPACDCAIPSYGSHNRPNGAANTLCCPENQICDIWGSDTCPRNCGVEIVNNSMCNNGAVDPGEECDAIDTLKQFLFSPNLEGTKTSFAEDNDRWGVVPVSIEKKYTTVDHTPSEPMSPDSAFIRSKKQGEPVTYFHLWDVPSDVGSVINLEARIGVDFTGTGTDWKVMKVQMMRFNIQAITIADMNAAVVVVEGDEENHRVLLTLYHANGRQLTHPAVFDSPVNVQGASNIDVDAIEILAQFASEMDASACVECIIERCGNRIVEDHRGETCDDGNVENNDGCSNQCQLEICSVP